MPISFTSENDHYQIPIFTIKQLLVILSFFFISYAADGQHSLCNNIDRLTTQIDIDSLLQLHENTLFDSWQEQVCINLFVSRYLRDEIGSCKQALKALNKNINRHKIENQNSEDGTLLAKFNSYLGYCQDQEENFESALYHYGLARALFRDSIEFEQSYLAMYVITPIGNIHTRRGDYQKALLNLTKANQILVSQQQFSLAAGLLTNIGIAHSSMGEHQAALDTFLSAERQISNDNFASALAKLNIAYEYAYLRNYQKGIESINRALSIMDRDKNNRRAGEFPMLQAECYSLMATLHANQNKFIEAEASIELALKITNSIEDSESNREIAKMHSTIGDIYLSQGKPEKTFEHIRQALHALIPEIKIKGRDNPLETDLFAENTFAEIMDLKARSYYYLYQQSDNAEYLKDNLSCYQVMFHIWDLLRKKYNYTSSHRHVLKQNRTHLEQALHVVFLLREQESNENYDDLIIDLLRCGKNLLLQESLQKKYSTNVAHADSIKKALQLINYDISKLKQKQFDNSNKRNQNQTIDSLDFALDLAMEKRNNLENQLVSSRDSTLPKRNTTYQTLNDIQQTINDDQTFIDYFLGDSLLFIYSFDRDKSIFLQSPSGSICRKSIDTLRSGLLDYVNLPGAKQYRQEDENAYEQYLSAAHTLYNILIEPIGRLEKKLVIIPDASLSHVPFEILLKSKHRSTDKTKSLAYLLRDHTVSYQYSREIIDLPDEKQIKFLGFAPEFALSDQPIAYAGDFRRNYLGPLPWAAEEVQRIANLINGTVLIGNEANLNNFFKTAGDYQILHLATHSKIEDLNSDFSYLAFADSLRGTSKLYLNDLSYQNIQSTMVVLSACETGLGELHEGDGVASLARGFTEAGARSIITSLWQVNDKATSNIMVSFYKNLKRGNTKDDALRQAKLDYVDNQVENKLAHPFYWAGFIAIGDMDSISFNGHDDLDVLHFLLFTVLLILLVLLIRYFNRKRK